MEDANFIERPEHDGGFSLNTLDREEVIGVIVAFSIPRAPETRAGIRALAAIVSHHKVVAIRNFKTHHSLGRHGEGLIFILGAQVRFREFPPALMFFIQDVHFSIHEFHFFPRQSDDAFDVEVLGIMRRPENDDVSTLRRTVPIAEEGIIDSLVHDEVFAEAVPAAPVNFIEGVAHGRTENLERRDEVGAHGVNEDHDDYDIHQKIPEEVEGGVFFLKAIKPEPLFGFFGFKHACYT